MQRWAANPDRRLAQPPLDYLFGTANPTPYVKDGINNYVVAGRQNATNPNNTGTKAAAHYQLRVGAGASATIRLRLNQVAPGESRGGVSPPRAPRSVREPLGSYGSRCSAVGIQEAPVGKQRGIGSDDPSQPSPCPRGTRSQSLVFVATPADQVDVYLPQVS